MTEPTTTNITPESVNAENNQLNTNPQITVQDLFQIVKFLENLGQMKRLSELEIAGIKPPFDNVVAFLAFYEAQAAAQAASTVTEVSKDELDLTEVVKPKKVKGKKK